MHTLTERQLWYGVDKQPPETRELRAGPLTALLDGIDLRYVRIGSLEVVRRIYMAVRDQNWNTIPGRYRVTRVDLEQDGFEVKFEVEHTLHELDFAWQGRIVGARDGHIRYEMNGVPKSDFRYNRIGLCILHPFKESSGRPYRAQTPGGEVSGYLPELIGPQRFENGFYVPLFPACSSLTVDLTEDTRVHFTFEGDLFEMEDQRNWTDASFKTYCTPLSLGFPHQARTGVGIMQSVTVHVEGEHTTAEKETGGLRVSIGHPTNQHLPDIGFGMASDAAALTVRELELLHKLKPDHLRVDVHLTRDYTRDLEQAQGICRVLECDLEGALFITQQSGSELARLASLMQGRARVVRFLVFQEEAQTATPTETTAPELIGLARQHLREVMPQAACVGGTDMYFCELNRTRPRVEAMDGVSYTIIPQAHAFDERSLAETLEAQGETVKSTRAFAGDRPVIVSPITLKRRYNPHATEVEAEREADELPDAVDPRQMSLFGAAWTAGSIKYLAESGAASLTYYETVGWRGLMERESGSELPEHFPSEPEMVFPLYHVFADVAGWKGGSIVECSSNRPLEIATLAVESEGSLHLLVANLAGVSQRVVIGPLGIDQVSVRSLDESTAPQAMFEPESFRRNWQKMEIQNRALVLDMAPYATVRIDV
jgi:hypothetical protein